LTFLHPVKKKEKARKKWLKAFVQKKEQLCPRNPTLPPQVCVKTPPALYCLPVAQQHNMEQKNCAKHAKITPPASYIDSPDPRSS
jgi:hypothetical protein